MTSNTSVKINLKTIQLRKMLKRESFVNGSTKGCRAGKFRLDGDPNNVWSVHTTTLAFI